MRPPRRPAKERIATVLQSACRMGAISGQLSIVRRQRPGRGVSHT